MRSTVIALLGLILSAGACSREDRVFNSRNSAEDGASGNNGDDVDSGSGDGEGSRAGNHGSGDGDGDGDGDAGGTSGDNDAGDGVDEGLRARILFEADIVGFPSRVSGAGSQDELGQALTYTWSFVSLPANSELTAAAFTAPDSVETEFLPDIGGNYEVSLLVTAEDGRSATTTATLKVRTYWIPHFIVSGDDNNSTRSASVVRSDGTGAHEVGCAFTQEVDPDWVGGFAMEGQFNFQSHMPTSANDDATSVYVQLKESGSLSLFIASEDSNCDLVPPVELELGEGAIPLPVLSPDASRVALYIPDTADGGTGVLVATVGVNGSDYRLVREREPTTSEVSQGSRLFWIDDHTLGWSETVDSKTQIVAVPDEANAFANLLKRQILMDCTDASPAFTSTGQVAMAGDRLVLTNYNYDIGSGHADKHSIYSLPRREDGTYSCQRDAPGNKMLSLALEPALDFEVSPDGQSVAFITLRGGDYVANQGSDLYVVPVDGRAPPRRLAGEGPAPMFADGGLVSVDGGYTGAPSMVSNSAPRWAANGRQLVWTHSEWLDADGNAAERPRAAEVRVINADGSGEHVARRVISTEGQSRAVTTGAHGGICSVLGIGLPTTSWQAELSALLLACGLWRRRRSVTAR